MFCKKCGQSLPEGSAFCSNCGTKMNIPSKLSSASPISTSASMSAVVKGKNKLVSVIAVVIIVILIVVTIAIFGGSGKRTAGSAAESYLTACYKEDVDLMISLVPDAVIKEITEEYGCSTKELKKAVSEEISNWSDRISYNNDKVLDSYKKKDVDEKDYEDYFDRRVEMCVDYNKISTMGIYRVDLKNEYYFDIPVYKYGGKWYVTDAAIFVAYAVWERY